MLQILDNFIWLRESYNVARIYQYQLNNNVAKSITIEET